MSRAPSPAPFRPTASSLGTLVALAAANALLALFLWAELLLARAGGSTFCALSSPDSCARLWDGAFASAIHRASGLPIAGWGLVWALVATALALVALVRRAEDQPHAAWLGAIRLLAAGGVVAVGVLASAAIAAKSFCIGCFLTYALTLAYAGVALLAWRPLGWPEPKRAAGIVVAGLALTFGLLLYPGKQTPAKSDASGREALVRSGAGATAPAGAAPARPAAGSDALSQFVASLPPAARQTLADSLYLYRNGIAFSLGPARSLHGPAGAPLRITDFTDIRCGHCAELHATLDALATSAPAGSFAVEPRHFPLDGACNPYVRQATDPVRCLAARAQICAENRPGAKDYTGRLFARQATLTSDEVFSLAEGVIPRPELERCVADAATDRKLREDIDLAMRYQLDGTPLVLINGRKATSFAPFLYAMTLTGGRIDHPAFQGLPPANPSAHIH
jgi:protein-disulfide isomerase/heme/copper-type cytochrome/quinol oxidase subunit 3